MSYCANVNRGKGGDCALKGSGDPLCRDKVCPGWDDPCAIVQAQNACLKRDGYMCPLPCSFAAAHGKE